MFLACFRLALVIGAAYVAYRSHRVLQEHREAEPPHINLDRRKQPKPKGKCIICNKVVEYSHKEFKNSCGCQAHDPCMNSLIKEGQNICPGCKEPLNNLGGAPGKSKAN